MVSLTLQTKKKKLLENPKKHYTKKISNHTTVNYITQHHLVVLRVMKEKATLNLKKNVIIKYT